MLRPPLSFATLLTITALLGCNDNKSTEPAQTTTTSGGSGGTETASSGGAAGAGESGDGGSAAVSGAQDSSTSPASSSGNGGTSVSGSGGSANAGGSGGSANAGGSGGTAATTGSGGAVSSGTTTGSDLGPPGTFEEFILDTTIGSSSATVVALSAMTDSNEVTHLVWSGASGAGLSYATFEDGVFEVEEIALPFSSPSVQAPSLLTTASGEVHIAFYAQGAVYYATPTTEGFSIELVTPEDEDSDFAAESSIEPLVSLDGSGHPVVYYEPDTVSYRQIRATRTAEATWEYETIGGVSDDLFDATSAVPSSIASGEFAISTTNLSSSEMTLAWRDAAGWEFETVQYASSGSDAELQHPHMELDDSGLVHYFFEYRYDDTSAFYHGTVSDEGDQGRDAALLPLQGGVHGYRTVDRATGAYHFAFRREVDDAPRLFLATMQENGNFVEYEFGQPSTIACGPRNFDVRGGRAVLVGCIKSDLVPDGGKISVIVASL